MTELEKQLLEFWTADAAVWRAHFHKLECQSGPQTKIDRSKQESERVRAEKLRLARRHVRPAPWRPRPKARNEAYAGTKRKNPRWRARVSTRRSIEEARFGYGRKLI